MSAEGADGGYWADGGCWAAAETVVVAWLGSVESRGGMFMGGYRRDSMYCQSYKLWYSTEILVHFGSSIYSLVILLAILSNLRITLLP